jgi:hypothetical protein
LYQSPRNQTLQFVQGQSAKKAVSEMTTKSTDDSWQMNTDTYTVISSASAETAVTN